MGTLSWGIWGSSTNTEYSGVGELFFPVTISLYSIIHGNGQSWLEWAGRFSPPDVSCVGVDWAQGAPIASRASPRHQTMLQLHLKRRWTHCTEIQALGCPPVIKRSIKWNSGQRSWLVGSVVTVIRNSLGCEQIKMSGWNCHDRPLILVNSRMKDPGDTSDSSTVRPSLWSWTIPATSLDLFLHL